jgi:hypothetical protein
MQRETNNAIFAITAPSAFLSGTAGERCGEVGKKTLADFGEFPSVRALRVELS